MSVYGMTIAACFGGGICNNPQVIQMARLSQLTLIWKKVIYNLRFQLSVQHFESINTVSVNSLSVSNLWSSAVDYMRAYYAAELYISPFHRIYSMANGKKLEFRTEGKSIYYLTGNYSLCGRHMNRES